MKSLKKNTAIDKSVPKWRAKSNVKFKFSLKPVPIPNKSLNIIKCADDDIGRNSAIPWIIPNIIIDKNSIYSSPNLYPAKVPTTNVIKPTNMWITANLVEIAPIISVIILAITKPKIA